MFEEAIHVGTNLFLALGLWICIFGNILKNVIHQSIKALCFLGYSRTIPSITEIPVCFIFPTFST